MYNNKSKIKVTSFYLFRFTKLLQTSSRVTSFYKLQLQITMYHPQDPGTKYHPRHDHNVLFHGTSGRPTIIHRRSNLQIKTTVDAVFPFPQNDGRNSLVLYNVKQSIELI